MTSTFTSFILHPFHHTLRPAKTKASWSLTLTPRQGVHLPEVQGGSHDRRNLPDAVLSHADGRRPGRLGPLLPGRAGFSAHLHHAWPWRPAGPRPFALGEVRRSPDHPAA